MTDTVPKTSLGKTKSQITRVGLGGEGILRTYGREAEAAVVIGEAFKQGIGYFDSARVYSDSEVYLGHYWGQHKEQRADIFQTSKSASRDKKGALADLEQTLERLQTGYLDLWQIHDVRSEEDLRAIARTGGALEAFLQAKDNGKIRHIGVTGHHDPYILTKAVEQWPVDTVLMPVNPAEAILGGFLTETLPAARRKGVGIIAMKVLGASHYIMPKFGITAEKLVRYALSFDVDVVIVGCGSAAEVTELAEAGRSEKKLSAEEKKKIETIFEPYARRLAFYRGV